MKFVPRVLVRQRPYYLKLIILGSIIVMVGFGFTFTEPKVFLFMVMNGCTYPKTTKLYFQINKVFVS